MTKEEKQQVMIWVNEYKIPVRRAISFIYTEQYNRRMKDFDENARKVFVGINQ